jgi:restriction system protein
MAYRQIWEIEVRHEGLNKYRHIRGVDRYVVEQKALIQRLAWNEMWENRLQAEERKNSKLEILRSKLDKAESATTRAKEAEENIRSLEGVLSYTLKVDDTIVWESLFDKKPYEVESPKKPTEIVISPPPNQSSLKYIPQLGFLDAFFPKSRKEKERIVQELFAKDMADWEAIKKQTEVNRKVTENQWAQAVKAWEKDKEEYRKEQNQNNLKILERKKAYIGKDADAIVDYCDMVLASSQYPECLSPDWSLDYQSDSGIIVVDYSLPSPDDLPKTKAVKYIAARDEFVESFVSVAELNRLYDSVLYQIALRTIHELFEADVANALSSIVFNGWVNFIEKATGCDSNACVLSVQAEKDEFMAINLERVDPKACFVQLKGVGSSKLHGLTPVAPIINTNTQDKRFVSSYEVINKIDGSVNLAAIDWQDFENLIREIFEKEFSSNGGEVKITQASRDGGVDAVAFDPDPIRGGKIVIQAKRYTNVVGVSAVRDLYGTTMNEGATKGILVTTANYGPDAYEFAKGKPLTLLNGSNLLHLLEKHGHKAKIDLKEAKAILNAEKN